MYKIITVFLILAVSCTEKEKIKEETKSLKSKNVYAGFWENKGPWRKWMVISLKLEENNKFKFWFTSDKKLRVPTKYPIEGTYKIENNILTLSSDRAEELYSKEYKIIKENGEKLFLCTSQLSSWEEEGRPDCHPLYKTEKIEIK